MPESPPRADQQKTLDSFALGFEDPAVLEVDRSTLERYGLCPAQARLVDQGRCAPVGLAAEVGQAVHMAYSESITEYIESGGDMPAQELRKAVESHLSSSRPDVQPQAIQAARASLWNWSRYVAGIHAQCILRYDGGSRLAAPDDPEANRSGQLSHDVEMGHDTVRITSELDLLHSTNSIEVLAEVDYKSGWKQWTFSDVFEAFQFSTHAVLVFHNYPQVNFLEVRVWSTRSNSLTPKIVFERRKLAEYETRIQSAVGEWYRWRNSDDAPAWPAEEKCRICPCAGVCPEATGTTDFDVSAIHSVVSALEAFGHVKHCRKKECKSEGGCVCACKDCIANRKAEDAETVYRREIVPKGASAALLAFVAGEYRQSAISDYLWSEVERAGEDIAAGCERFGWNKPKRRVKSANAIYQE